MEIARRNLVYFSSVSENTHRFVQKLGVPATRIPLHDRIEVDEPYVLVLPTYGGGQATPNINDGGYVPKQVIAFLNNEHNRSLIRGVIAAGNNNFGAEFAYAGNVVVPQVRRSVPLPLRTDGNPGRRGCRPRGLSFGPTSGRNRRATNRRCRACNLRRARVVRRNGLPRAERDAESV